MIREAADLLNEKREMKGKNVGVFTVCMENKGELLQKYCKEFEGFEEILEENEENKKNLENYKCVIIEASKLLNQLKGVIKGHRQILGANQRENQRNAEAGEREKQRKAEAEERENQRKAEPEERENQSRSRRMRKGATSLTRTGKITYRWKTSAGENRCAAIKYQN